MWAEEMTKGSVSRFLSNRGRRNMVTTSVAKDGFEGILFLGDGRKELGKLCVFNAFHMRSPYACVKKGVWTGTFSRALSSSSVCMRVMDAPAISMEVANSPT